VTGSDEDTLPDGGTTADIPEEKLYTLVRSAVIDGAVSLLRALGLGVLAVAFSVLGMVILLEASDPFGVVFLLLGAVMFWFARGELG